MPELVVTRPRALAERFARVVPAPWRAVVAPLTRIEALPVAGKLPADAQALLFTSQNGVACWVAGGAKPDLPVFCVGSRTAQAAREAGFVVHDAAGDLSALIALIAARLSPQGGALVHPHGRHVAGDPAAALAQHGFAYHPVAVYDAVTAALTEEVVSGFRAGRFGGVTFFSPRAARLFAAQAQAESWPLGGVAAFCISRNAANPLTDLAFADCHISHTPDESGIIAMLQRNGIG